MSENPINPTGVCDTASAECISAGVLFSAQRPRRAIYNWTHHVTYLQLDLFYLLHFSPTASVAATGANYSVSKNNKTDKTDEPVSVCVSGCVCASPICDSSQPEAEILWGTPRKLHLALISLHLPRACWAAHFLTNSPHWKWDNYSTNIWHQNVTAA